MMKWQPSATIGALRERAKFLQCIRQFFDERGLMEVDTPLLSQSVVTAPHLASFHINGRYLQTSPEYAMKRLLSAGSGSIYYLGKAFRQEEVGKRHNPEFTMLEWYRIGWDHLQLIEEVDALLQTLLGTQKAQVITYAALFQQYYGINPHLETITQLQQIAIAEGWIDRAHLPEMDKDGWLDLIISHGIEPYLGQPQPTVVIDFPASQASLAQKRKIDGYEVASRFEFYYGGVELANGYHELGCAKELKLRFQEDLEKRKSLGLCELPIDEALLSAMEAGFPPCAGVAIGVDRLLMLKLQEKNIANVLPFGWENA